jgi:hypothetical protein
MAPAGSSTPRVATTTARAPVDDSATLPSLVSSAHVPSSTPPPRPRTRLQNNIVKPKKLFPEMIRYANFCSTGEPENFHEALDDPQWKHAMDLEYAALLQNDMWHLVPASQASNIIDCK